MSKRENLYTAYEIAKNFDIPHSTIKDDISRYGKFNEYIESGEMKKEDGKWMIPERVIREVYEERICRQELQKADEFKKVFEKVNSRSPLDMDGLYTVAGMNRNSLKFRVIMPSMVDVYFENKNPRDRMRNIFADFYQPLHSKKKGWLTQYGSEAEIVKNNVLFIELVIEKIGGEKFDIEKSHIDSIVEMIEDFILMIQAKWDTHKEIRKMAVVKLESYRDALKKVLPKPKIAMLDMVIEKNKQEVVLKLESNEGDNPVTSLKLPSLISMKREDVKKLLAVSYHLFERKDQKKLVYAAYKKFDRDIFKGTQVEGDYEAIAENEIAVKALKSNTKSFVELKKLDLLKADKEDATLINNKIAEFIELAGMHLKEINELLGVELSGDEMETFLMVINDNILGLAAPEQTTYLMELLETSTDFLEQIKEVQYPTNQTEFDEFNQKRITLNNYEKLICFTLGILNLNRASYKSYGFYVENKVVDFERTLMELERTLNEGLSEVNVLNWVTLKASYNESENIFEKINPKKFLEWSEGIYVKVYQQSYATMFKQYWEKRGKEEILKYALLEGPVSLKGKDYSVKKFLNNVWGDEDVQDFINECGENYILNSDKSLSEKLDWVVQHRTFNNSNAIFAVLEQEMEILEDGFYLLAGKGYSDSKESIEGRYDALAKEGIERILSFINTMLKQI